LSAATTLHTDVGFAISDLAGDGSAVLLHEFVSIAKPPCASGIRNPKLPLWLAAPGTATSAGHQVHRVEPRGEEGEVDDLWKIIPPWGVS